MTDDDVRLEKRRRESITLRDEFAKAAMQGFLAFVGPDTEADFDTLAQMAYDMADAMMEQREKRP